MKTKIISVAEMIESLDQPHSAPIDVEIIDNTVEDLGEVLGTDGRVLPLRIESVEYREPH